MLFGGNDWFQLEGKSETRAKDHTHTRKRNENYGLDYRKETCATASGYISIAVVKDR